MQAPWVSVDRRPCPCRRPRGRSATRRDRRAGRPWHLLLPRRTPLAQVFSLDPRAQHHRGGRPRPVQLGRSLLVDSPRAEQPGRIGGDAGGNITAWSAEHDGYRTLNPPVRHHRTVRLDSPTPTTRDRRLPRDDRTSRLPVCVAPGPRHRRPHGWADRVELTWSNGQSTRRANLCLPSGPIWSLTRGQTDPVLGWYSPRFGEKQPAWALLGEGTCSGMGSDSFTTVLQFVR